MDALGEEHRGVAMGVERQDTIVRQMGLAIGSSLGYQPLEQGKSRLQALGMPLHTQHRLKLGALDRLDDAISGLGHHAELITRRLHGLMVERVDKKRLLVDLSKCAIRLDDDSVGGLRAVGILRMLHGGLVADVLIDRSAKGDGKGLDAPADAQHRDLTVVGQTGDQQLRQIALFIDAT